MNYTTVHELPHSKGSVSPGCAITAQPALKSKFILMGILAAGDLPKKSIIPRVLNHCLRFLSSVGRRRSGGSELNLEVNFEINSLSSVTPVDRDRSDRGLNSAALSARSREV